MLQGIDAELHEAFEVKLLHVLRMGLQDHLELVVVLHPVRVLAVPAVGRAAGRLDIGRGPGLGSENAEKGRRMEGPRADLDIVRLVNDASLRRPVILQRQYNFLKCQVIASIRRIEKESKCAKKIECYYTKIPYLVK